MISSVQITEALDNWAQYRRLYPRSEFQHLFVLDSERHQLDCMADELTTKQWTETRISDPLAMAFITRVAAWQDSIIVEILQHGLAKDGIVN